MPLGPLQTREIGRMEQTLANTLACDRGYTEACQTFTIDCLAPNRRAVRCLPWVRAGRLICRASAPLILQIAPQPTALIRCCLLST